MLAPFRPQGVCARGARVTQETRPCAQTLLRIALRPRFPGFNIRTTVRILRVRRRATIIVRIIVFIFAVALSLTAFADDSGFTSPNKAFVVVATADSHRSDSYAIRTTAAGRTLASCPDDGRCSGAPESAVWTADSHLVAIQTQLTQHAGAADIWLLDASKARQVRATFPDEDGSFYFTPKRWLNETDLKCEVIGILNQRRAPDPKNSVKGYSLILRVDRKACTAKVLKTTKPSYGHF